MVDFILKLEILYMYHTQERRVLGPRETKQSERDEGVGRWQCSGLAVGAGDGEAEARSTLRRVPLPYRISLFCAIVMLL